MIFKQNKWVSSYSQIDKFKKCPYSWHLNYVEGIKDGKKKKALEYGLAVHETLEYYFEKLKNGEKPSVEEMDDVYGLTFDCHNIPFDSEEEKEEAYREGLVCIARLYHPISELEKMFDSCEILGVEEPLEVKIKFDTPLVKVVDGEEVEVDEVTIIGFIDLVLKTNEGIVLVDHKSGKKTYAKSVLAKNLQFPIYAMHVKEKYGVLPVRSIYNFTKVHKEQEVEITEERLEEAVEDIKDIFRKMFRPKSKKNPQEAIPTPLCYWCDYGKYNGGQCSKSSLFKPKEKKES